MSHLPGRKPLRRPSPILNRWDVLSPEGKLHKLVQWMLIFNWPSSGGLFDEGDDLLESSFKNATKWVNSRRELHQFNLLADSQKVDAFNNFQVSNAVCEMLSRGVAGVFGPRSMETSDHVQSVCDAMEIPHVEMRWDSRQRRGSCLVNLYPHPSTITKASICIFLTLHQVF